jgi:hypothetical protein
MFFAFNVNIPVGGMAQVVEHIPSNHKALKSNSHATKKSGEGRNRQYWSPEELIYLYSRLSVLEMPIKFQGVSSHLKCNCQHCLKKMFFFVVVVFKQVQCICQLYSYCGESVLQAHSLMIEATEVIQ